MHQRGGDGGGRGGGRGDGDGGTGSGMDGLSSNPYISAITVSGPVVAVEPQPRGRDRKYYIKIWPVLVYPVDISRHGFL